MRRRLTLAFVAMAAGSLLLVGLVTLVLTIGSARRATKATLITQGRELATVLRTRNRTGVSNGPVRLRAILTLLRAPLRLEGEAVLGITPDGRIFSIDHPLARVVLPSGLSVGQVDVGRLLTGKVDSGGLGNLVWVAAPYRASVVIGVGRHRRVMANLAQFVFLTRRAPTGLADAGPWFVVTSILTLVVAAGTATWLGGRITRPLADAEAATRRIAAGDLETQVPEPPPSDPELASLARSINSMAAALARSRGLERQFFMSVSHELRTPLTSIRGFAEAIADGTAVDAPRAGAVVAAESRRLERLVRDLLELASLDARQFSLRPRGVDIGEVVADTGEGFALAAGELGLELRVQLGTDTLMADIDPDRLAQITANLIENALKYATSTVVVGAARSGAGVVIFVDDDGPGIAPEDLGRVFERLFRSEQSRARKLGSGLGLAIVAELVSAMGGSVSAVSPLTTGHGTRMEVTMPARSLPGE